MTDNAPTQRWPLRFDPGEREARRASGEWLGRTLADAARERAEATPDAVAIVEGDGELTYGAAWRDAQALARGMAEMGLRPGDAVSFQLPNWAEAAVLNLACVLGGYVVNPIIPIYRQAELRFILRDCGAKALFIPAEFRGVDYPDMIAGIRADLPALEHVVTLRDGGPGLAGLMREEGDLPPPPDPDGAKMALYTSGTTGRPKGVLWSHNQADRALRACYEAWGLGPRTTVLMPSPITHVTGFSHGLEAPFQMNARAVLTERWDADRAVALIDAEAADYMVGATPFLVELIEAAKRAGTRLPSLKVFACGGAAVPPSVIRAADAQFANGVAFRVYGSSEAPMITQGVTGADPASRRLAAETDGRVSGWEVRVLGPDGAVAPEGGEGEIAARGPALFRGYTDPEETARAFDADGFFRTGDLGVLNADGTILVTGRIKDLIIRGGENISAKEIEDALHEHPDIAECAVVAFPHERLGEGVRAALVLRPGAAAPDRAALRDFLTAKGLARQKSPERVDILDALPKTASGKVQKHVLRAMSAEPAPSR